jgi:hypothetical protein
VRRLLRPLASIDAGVTRFGAGDFAQPIVTRAARGSATWPTHQLWRAACRACSTQARAAAGVSRAAQPARGRVNASSSRGRARALRDLAAMRDLIADLLESERLASGHAALQTETVHLPRWVRAGDAQLPACR